MHVWLSNRGPFGRYAIMEIEGNADYLDPDFGQCRGSSQGNQQKVSPEDMLVTVAQNSEVCQNNGLSAAQCEDPNPPVPTPPTKQELCESNNVPYQVALDLCDDQQVHGDAIYEGCLYDVCASAEADAQQRAVGGAALEGAMMNQRAVCLISGMANDACRPCNICSDSTPADLSNVVSNNLGGVGPNTDDPEEIRYKDAINLNGRLVDVVLVALQPYVTPKPERNGNKDGLFGRFTIRTGTSTQMNFLFQDAATHEPVAIPDISLTFYDIDEAIEFRDENQLQRETLTVCSAEEVYVTEDSELIYVDNGRCKSVTSSVIGDRFDNPTHPDTLTKAQAARSVTYEFHSRANIFWTAEITGNRLNPRPILFSFLPQVACGASDSETQCADA